jgi:hypothetical protein
MTIDDFLGVLMWVTFFRYLYVRKNPIKNMNDEITILLWQIYISSLSYMLLRAFIFSCILPFFGYL